MAQFDVGLNFNAKDYVGASQGTRPAQTVKSVGGRVQRAGGGPSKVEDTSSSFLIGGLGGAAIDLFGVADYAIQNSIKQQVYSSVDTFRDQQGVGDAAAATKAVDEAHSPEELAKAQARMTVLKKASDEGKITNTYYLGQLETTVRDLRMKYPGYREKIDDIMQTASGVVPANALRAQLMADRTNALDDAQKERMWAEHYAMEHGGLPEWYDNSTPTEKLKDEISKRSKLDAEQEAVKAAVELADKTDPDPNDPNKLVSHKQLVEQTTTAVVNAMDKMYMDMTDPLGKAYNQMDEQTKLRLTATGPQDPQVLQNELQHINALELQARQAIAAKVAVMKTPLSNEEYKALEEVAMKKITFFKDAYLQKDIGAINAQQNLLKQAQTNLGLQALSNDFIQMYAGVAAAGGGVPTSTFFMTSPAMGPFNRAVADGTFMHALSGNPAFDAGTDRKAAIENGINGEGYRELLSQPAKVITHPQVNPKQISAVVPYFYNTNKDNYASNFVNALKSGEDKIRAFSMVTSPEITKNIKEKGTPQDWEMYSTWSFNTYAQIARQEAETLSSAAKHNEYIEVRQDPNTMKLYTIPTAPQGANDNWVNRFVTSLGTGPIEDSVRRLNIGIANLNAIADADPDTVEGTKAAIGHILISGLGQAKESGLTSNLSASIYTALTTPQDPAKNRRTGK